MLFEANIVREAHLRTRILPDHGALFYKVDLNVAFLLQLLHPKRIRAVPEHQRFACDLDLIIEGLEQSERSKQ